MPLVLPRPNECAECGPDAIFHRATYITITIDSFFNDRFHPNAFSRFVQAPFLAVERILTPHVIEFLMNTSLATRVTEPDDDTQLLALMIWNEAKKRGIEVVEFRLFGLPRNVFVARYPDGKKIAYEGIPLPPSESNRAWWTDNKSILKEQFRKRKLPIAKGDSAGTLRTAKKIFSTLTPPAIVKPFSGSASRHTILHVMNDADLERAFRIATQVAPKAVIEEELIGPVYRATVVNGKFAASLRRDQPYVRGDGVHTITELVAEANKNPGRHGPYFHEMKLNDAAKKELDWQELSFESVPEKGRRVTLHEKINWSSGGTTADTTDETHPDNIALFEEVAKVLKAPIVGIDFIIEDISRSWKETARCGIIECNSMPFFDNHHLPFEGKPRDVAKLIWDMVLEN